MRSDTKTLIDELRLISLHSSSEDWDRSKTISGAADRMEELCSELLFQKRLAEKYVEAGKICAKIYIARNITLSEKCIVSALAEIDKTYRTKNDGN